MNAAIWKAKPSPHLVDLVMHCKAGCVTQILFSLIKMVYQFYHALHAYNQCCTIKNIVTLTLGDTEHLRFRPFLNISDTSAPSGYWWRLV